MSPRPLAVVTFTATLLALVSGGTGSADPGAPGLAKRWGAFATPADGPARAVGNTSGGCLIGGVRLPRTGTGYRVAEPKRRRDFGHPALIAFVRDLGELASRERLGVVTIGDLSQPRGGPARGGHASHQTGLDVDVWYALARRGAERRVSMIDPASARALPRLDDGVRRLLALAASDPRVDRIIVNPIVKRALCEGQSEDRAYLRKLRPWWGHDEHFHVRLACPPDSPECEPQAPLPPGDGCGELGWWLDERHADERAEQRRGYRGRLGRAATLPPACLALVDDAR